MNTNKPCVRCLLEAAGKLDVAKLVAEQIGKLKPQDLAPAQVVHERLSLCTACDYLSKGTCLKCGCYVELRAAAKKTSCPAKKW